MKTKMLGKNRGLQTKLKNFVRECSFGFVFFWFRVFANFGPGLQVLVAPKTPFF